MSDETSALTAEITFNPNGAPATIDDLSARLQNLEQAYIRSSGAAKDTGTAHQQLGGVLKEHGDIVDGVATHYRMMTAGLGAMGIQADAAAVKIDALTQVMRGMGDAAPELLLIGAAIAVAAASFEFLKSSVDEAAASQREMVVIGSLIKNQGVTDWQSQTKAVDDYASAIARTSVFQKTDALAGMQAMLVAGLTLNDTIRSQAAAMDLAASKGTSLAESDQALADAYDGRFRGLVKLGIITKEEQKNGIDYEVILQRIESRMSGSAAAALDTYSGKMQNLSNLTDLLKEQFGNALLPVLEAFEDGMRSGVASMQPLADEFTTWAHQHLPELKAGAEGFSDAMFSLAKNVLPMVEQGVEKAATDLAQLGKAWSDDSGAVDGWAKNIRDAKADVDSFVSAGAALDTWLNDTNDDFKTSGQIVHDWALGIFDDIKGAVTQLGILAGFRLPNPVNTGPAQTGGGWGGPTDPLSLTGGPTVANARAAGLPLTVPGDKGASQHHDIAPPTHPSTHHIPGTSTPHAPKESGAMDTLIGAYDKGNPVVEAFKQEQIDLDAALKANDSTEKQLAESVKTAMTVEGQRTAQAKLEAQTYVDLLDKQKLLNGAIDSETITQSTLKSTIDGLIASRDKLAAQHDALADKERAGAKLTATQSREMHALQQEVHSADTEIGKLNATLSENNSQLNRNQTSLATVSDQLDDFKSKAAEAVGAASRSWEEYTKKRADAFSEDAGVAQLSKWLQQNRAALTSDSQETDTLNAAKVAYYGSTLAQLQSLDQDYLAKFAAAQQALVAAQASGDKARIASALTAEELISGNVTETEKRMEEVLAKYDEAYKANLASEQAAHKKFTDEEQKDETSFLDTILTKHQSLKDSLKSIWDQMATDYIKSLETMIVKSSLFTSINNSILPNLLKSMGMGAAVGVGAMGVGGANPQMDAATQAFIAAQKTATTATTVRSTEEHAATQQTTLRATEEKTATQATTTFANTGVTPATAALKTLTDAATLAAAAVSKSGGGNGGSPIPGATGSIPGFDGLNIAGIAGLLIPAGNGLPSNITQIAGQDIPTASASSGSSVFSQIQGALGSGSGGGGMSAIGGALTGLLTGSAVGGGNGDSALGGTLGGIAGSLLLHFPGGSQIGAMLGSYIGGLFGPHETQAQQPDIYNTANWGQADVNFNGAAGAQMFNGTPYTAASQYNVGMGGTPMYQQMEQWANANATNKGLTPDEQAMLQQILGLEGGNPNADFGVTNEKNGMATLADGQTISAQNLINLENSFTGQVGSGPASSALFQVSRTYPNLNTGTLNANGTYTPTPTNGTPSGTTPGSTTGGSNGNALTPNPGVPTVGSGDLQVSINIDSDMIALATIGPLATLLARRGQGMLPVNPNAWGSTTRYVKT